MSSPSALDPAVEECQRVVGEAYARPAGDDDGIDGVPAKAIVEPGSIEEARDVLRLATARGWKVVPRGGGSKLRWGGIPHGLDLILSTARLNRLVEHAAGDLVVTAEAGLPLRDLQRAVATSRQRLALDPPDDVATVGGVAAANASGPRRLRFGAARDLLIGLTVVLADGTAARSGGKVVKNVAGYDLGKLFIGSLGTLGIIVQATFRLHPLPRATRTVQLDVERPEDAGSLVRVLLQSSLVPSAIEVAWPSANDAGLLAVLFEGTEAGVEAQASAACGLAAAHARAAVLDEAVAERLWEDIAPRPWRPGEVRLKLSTLPTQLADVIKAVFVAGWSAGLSPRVAGRAGDGVLHVDLAEGEIAAHRRCIEALRAAPSLRDGSVVVLEASPALKREIDVWGHAGDALPLMRRIKDQFDPGRTLSPARFVGGL